VKNWAQIALSAGIGVAFGGLVALVVAVAWPEAPPAVPIVVGAASAIPGAYFAFYVIYILSFDDMSRALMVVCQKKMDERRQAEVAVFILSSCVGDRKIEFVTTAEIWVKLLTVCAESAKQSWFTTYTISLDDWPRLSDCVKEYTAALANNKGIVKTRNVVQETVPINIGDSALVADSKTAGATVYVYQAADVKGIIPERDGVEDYAMFDDKFVISGFPPRGQQLDSRTRVRVVLRKGGGTEMGKYKNAKEKLAAKRPAVTFQPATRQNGA